MRPTFPSAALYVLPVAADHADDAKAALTLQTILLLRALFMPQCRLWQHQIWSAPMIAKFCIAPIFEGNFWNGGPHPFQGAPPIPRRNTSKELPDYCEVTTKFQQSCNILRLRGDFVKTSWLACGCFVVTIHVPGKSYPA